MNALILAGGRGSRLAPWSAPKCLMPVRGVPILYRLLDIVAGHVDRATVCVGYRGSDVEEALRCFRTARLAVDVSVGREGDAMCSRLLAARDSSARSLILYGDELADVDIRALEREHAADRATLTFTTYLEQLPFGVVRHGTTISQREHVMVNIGFIVAEPGAFAYMRPEDDVVEWVNRVAASEEAVSVHQHIGKRVTINNLADLARAEEVW